MAGPPRFLEDPRHACPALRPRWDLGARPFRRSGTAFRYRGSRLGVQGTASAPTSSALSGLHHTAYVLAVYASQPRFASPPAAAPCATQDSLPAGGQPLPGRSPAGGLCEGFGLLDYIPSSFPGLPWRTPRRLRGAGPRSGTGAWARRAPEAPPRPSSRRAPCSAPRPKPASAALCGANGLCERVSGGCRAVRGPQWERGCAIASQLRDPGARAVAIRSLGIRSEVARPMRVG